MSLSEVAKAAHRPLEGVRVLVITSGHDVNDSRVYGREGRSAQSLGADVTMVGKLEKGTLEGTRALLVSAPRSRLARFLVQPWRCVWSARRERPDIVHIHDAEMLATLPVARLWWRKARFVYDVHEDFANLMLIRDWLPAAVKPLVRLATTVVESTLARWADGVVGVTPPLAAKFDFARTAVVYNFVPGEFFDRAAQVAKPPRRREFDLVHLGTLSARRALFLGEVLSAFHRLRPGARSLVLGASPDILALLRGRVPPDCTLIGKVPYAEIPQHLGNAKVGVDVHPWLGPHLEVALPVKVCEYMAAGCAVVTSTMPVLDEVLKESGIDGDAIGLLRSEAPEDYAHAALRFVDAIDSGADPGGELRVRARRHLSFDTEAEKLAGLYLSLLRDRGAA